MSGGLKSYVRCDITAKEDAFKAYQKYKSEEQRCPYKEANKAAKRAESMAKEEAYYDVYTKLDTRGENKYRNLPKTETEEVDISDIAYVEDEDGTILTEWRKIKRK